jgi:hypothetical protein
MMVAVHRILGAKNLPSSAVHPIPSTRVSGSPRLQAVHPSFGVKTSVVPREAVHPILIDKDGPG